MTGSSRWSRRPPTHWVPPSRAREARRSLESLRSGPHWGGDGRPGAPPRSRFAMTENDIQSPQPQEAEASIEAQLREEIEALRGEIEQLRMDSLRERADLEKIGRAHV